MKSANTIGASVFAKNSTLPVGSDFVNGVGEHA
jgi:hypothetical protein